MRISAKENKILYTIVPVYASNSNLFLSILIFGSTPMVEFYKLKINYLRFLFFLFLFNHFEDIVLYRVFRKNCVFFNIHCNPSLAYISLQEIFKVLNAMCTVTPIGWPIWPISVQLIAAQCLQGRNNEDSWRGVLSEHLFD